MTTTRTNGATALSPDALQREIDQIHREAKELTAERESLALASVRGDQKAIQRIEKIDEERSRLLARKETIQVAKAQLEREKREADWRKQLPHWRKIWGSEMRNEWGAASVRIEHLLVSYQPHDLAQLSSEVDDLAALEHKTARKVVNEYLERPSAALTHTAGDAEDLRRMRQQKVKLDEERDRLIPTVVAELLAGVEGKRPERLESPLKKARTRIQAERTNQRSLRA